MTQLLNQKFINAPVAVGGEGIYIDFLKDGVKTRIIDGASGAAVSSVGHSDDEIKQAMMDAAQNHVYTYSAAYSNNQSEELADYILKRSPLGVFSAATFTCSGSEANENSMKLTRKYFWTKGEPKRTKFISRLQSYHGSTIGALSLGDTSRRIGFDDILLPSERTLKTLQCYPYRHQLPKESLEEYKDRLLEDLEQVFIDNDPETIAGVFFETVTGTNFGCNIPVPGYLDGAKKICEKYGALLIFDEVMCGMGRCGTLHAWENFMTSGPDIQTIGKSIGAGYVSLAGILISPKVMKVLEDADNSGVMQTYHCHGFNCAVGLAVQKKVERDGLIENMKTQGNFIGESLREKLADCKYVGDVRGAGGFWAVEFVKDKETKEPFDESYKYAFKVRERMFDNGLQCLGMRGTMDKNLGDHIILCPAFSVSREEAEKIVDIAVSTIREIEAEVTD